MNEKDAYRYLEKEFVATFMDELIPGIFHNFANPLNGIMGRSELMQRRLTDFIEKIRCCYPDMETDLHDRCKKLLSDINAISDESRKFYDLFQISTGKFYALSLRNPDRLNLSKLIETEMGFADFYLDFKHDVTKEVRIDHDMPDISGITTYFSMALWALIRQAAKNIHDSKDRTFRIATGHDEKGISVTISPIDGRLLPGWQTGGSGGVIGDVTHRDVPDQQKHLFYALYLLSKSSQQIEMLHDRDANTLTVIIPYQRNTKEM